MGAKLSTWNKMKLEDKVIGLETAKTIAELCKKNGIELMDGSLYWYKGKLKCTQEPDEMFGDGKEHVVVYHIADEFELSDVPEIDIQDELTYYPAYDVAELGEILPKQISEECGTWDLMIEKNSVNGNWGIGYCSLSMNQPDIDIPSEAQARGKMLIYLLKNRPEVFKKTTK